MEQLTELEYKIVANIIFLENETDRRKIFANVSENMLENEITRSVYLKLKDVFDRYPNADSDAFLNILDIEEKKIMAAVLGQLISVNIQSTQLDNSLCMYKDLYNERKFQRDITDLVLGGNFHLSEIAHIVEQSRQEENINSAEKYISDYFKPLEQIPTGFPELDDLLGGGFIKGTVATIGARPSTGKTTLAINIASNNPDIKVLFFSLEMSSRMIYDRLIADKADVDYRLSGLHKINFNTVKSVISRYKNLTVVDEISSIESIISMIHNIRPELVIIDFVQIITTQSNFIDNRQRIDYISQMLKQTAKSLNCCILTLSQLTRNAKEKPTMSALKESGGLEQDCDYILLLHRDYVNDKSNEDISPDKTTLTLDKNKFGNTRELSYSFNGSRQRFTECEKMKHMKESEDIDEDLPF